jgi:hypothetical protein
VRLQLATPRSVWMRRPRYQRVFGRLAFPTAAERQRPRVRLNRYPHEIIGVAVYFGGQRYLPWVWPVWITGLSLTDEQFDRGARNLIDEEEARG